jgi:hypothetical protein
MAVELAAGLADVALFAAPGLGLAELTPALRGLPLPRRLAYGYLLGVSAVAGGLYVLSHLFGVPLRPPAVWALVALPTLAGLAARLARRRRGRARSAFAPSTAEPQRRTAAGHAYRALLLACAATAAMVCLGVLADAVADPVKDWDGRMTWCAQARYIRAAGTVDAEVLRNRRWFITHPQYPLLLPLAQVAAQEAFGADLESHAFRALYAAFFPALLLVLYDGARRWAGRTAAALVTLLAALVPCFTVCEGGATTTYSDLPLACFYGAGLVLLLARRAGAGDALAAGMLLAAAVLTKNEGAPLAAVALVLGAAAPGLGRRAAGALRAATRRRRLRRLAVAAAPALLALALLLSWRSAIPNREDEGYLGFVRAGDLWPAVFTQAQKFGPVLLACMGDRQHWLGFWWLAPVLLLAGWRLFRRPISRRLLPAALAPPAIGWVAYSVHWDPVYLADVTWDRFLMQAAIPLFLLLGCALAEILGRSPGAPRRVASAGGEGT